MAQKRRLPYFFCKRAFDVFASLVALIVLSPLFVIISLCIVLDTRGGVFYRQVRVGRNGKKFRMWKFRTMYAGSDNMISQLTPEQIYQYKSEFKIENDPRITKVGRVLRKTSLDELPQLFNILCNDMSIVGPRPVTEEEIETWWIDAKDEFLSVKPGLTGYWQAYARNDAMYGTGERQKMELYYIRSMSAWLDIKILFKTILSVITRRGIKQ